MSSPGDKAYTNWTPLFRADLISASRYSATKPAAWATSQPNAREERARSRCSRCESTTHAHGVARKFALGANERDGVAHLFPRRSTSPSSRRDVCSRPWAHTGTWSGRTCSSYERRRRVASRALTERGAGETDRLKSALAKCRLRSLDSALRPLAQRTFGKALSSAPSSRGAHKTPRRRRQ